MQFQPFLSSVDVSYRPLVSSLQNLVAYKWGSLEVGERGELRHFLMERLVSHHASLPPFVRNKIVKVIVFIGRSDWPQQYPEFLSHVFQVSDLL